MADQQPCPTCGRFANRPVTVDALVVRGDEVLLVRRDREPFKGHFALPGGFVDVSEDTRAACLRELNEEAGLAGRIVDLVGFYDSPARDPRRHTITFTYLVAVDGPSEPRAGDDASEVGWFPLDRLPPLAFDHGRMIADYVARRPRGQAE